MADSRFLSSPFDILAIKTDATPREIERAGQKWLGLLTVESAAARSYATPLGKQERTPALVRQAMAELRDPRKRMMHEIWATPSTMPASDDGDPRPDVEDEALLGSDMMRAVGLPNAGRRR